MSKFWQSILTANRVTVKKKGSSYSDLKWSQCLPAHASHSKTVHWDKSPLCLYRVSPLKLLIMLISFRLLRILLTSIIFPCKHLLSKINDSIFHRVPFKNEKRSVHWIWSLGYTLWGKCILVREIREERMYQRVQLRVILEGSEDEI